MSFPICRTKHFSLGIDISKYRELTCILSDSMTTGALAVGSTAAGAGDAALGVGDRFLNFFSSASAGANPVEDLRFVVAAT